MDEWRQHYRNKHEVYPGKMTHDDPGSPLGELEQRLDGWLGTPAGVYDCSGRDEPSKRGNPRLIQKISLARKEVLRDGDIELTPLETTATMAGVCCTVPICAVGSALTLLMGWIACSLGVGIECDGAKAGCRLMCCFACSGDGWDAGRSGCCDADSTHAPYRNCCDVMSAVCCQANKRGVTPKQDGLARAVEQLAMD